MRWLWLVALAGCGRFGFGDDDSKPIDARGIDSGSRYAEAVLADQPIGYWRFPKVDNAMVVDESGHQLHAGLLGAGVFDASLIAEPADYAIGFDGVTGYAEVPDNALLRFGGTVTLEAWIHPETFANASGAQYPRIVDKGNGGGTGHTLCVHQITTPSVMDLAYIRLELEGLTPFTLDGGTVLRPDQTYYVVGTFDGTMTHVYVNGVLDGEQPVAGTLTTSTLPLDIGRRPDAMRYWQGLIDEVAVYDKALTPAQIAAHFAAAQ